MIESDWEDTIRPSPFKIVRFCERQLQPTVKVIFSSLSQVNALWNLSEKEQGRALAEIRERVLPGLYSGHSFLLLYKNKIIGVSIQLDLVDYMRTRKPYDSESLFATHDRYSCVLECLVRKFHFRQGDALFSVFGVIDPGYTNLGYSLKFWWFQLAMGRQIGYKYFFAATYNEIALKLLHKIGARSLAAIDINELVRTRMYLVMINVRESPSFQKIVQSMLTDFKAKL